MEPTRSTVTARSRLALKEWAVTVAALREGRQVLLLRKGGIHEPGGELKVRGRELFLFPAYEHQRQDLLKPEAARRYAAHLDPAREREESVVLDAFARLEEVLELAEARLAFRLAEHHIWTEEYVRQRVEYKPERPLQVYVLRVHALLERVAIPRVPRYAGCRSWVDLEEEVQAAARPVLDDAAFARRLEAVRGLLAGS